MRVAVVNLTGGRMSSGYTKYLRNVLPRMASNPVVEAVFCASPQALNIQDCFKPISNVDFETCQSFKP